MAEISQKTQNLIQQYNIWRGSLQKKEGVSTIHVDETASQVAAFYEKIRGIVDWREEHLMKRAAIERMLKRRFLLKKNGEQIADPLVKELIRGGHFPNDEIEESKIVIIQSIIDKYGYILKDNSANISENEKLQINNWLFGVAACEIEEVLSPSLKERLLVDFMTEMMQERIIISEKARSKHSLSEEEKNNQIYIAVQRALFKMDSPFITYQLLKRKYSQWLNLSQSDIQLVAQNIYQIRKIIDKELNHPLSDKFYKICERYDTPYLLLGDVLIKEDSKTIEDGFASPENVESLIRKAYNKRFATLKRRLFKTSMYSTLSMLLTNIFSIFFLEIPVAGIIKNAQAGIFNLDIFNLFSLLTIAVDMFGPPILMLFLTITIRPPSKNNVDLVMMEAMKVIYKKEKVDHYEIKISGKRGIITKFFIGIIYLIGTILSFGTIVLVFHSAGFPITSILINVVFVAVTAFTALVTREKARELSVERPKEGISNLFFDILVLPLASIGRWISIKWKKYNAIAAFFNALIDMPWELFVEFLEQWKFFLQEKKEEIH